MPKIANLAANEMQNGSVGSFNYSGIRLDRLGAAEYTLATFIMDTTGSVAGTESELLQCLISVVEACKKSPRAENLLFRYVTFDNHVMEQHGFVPLSSIDISAYKRPHAGGVTALFDAMFASVAAANKYGKDLTDNNFSANAITIVCTDGGDNCSKMSPKDIRDELARVAAKEEIESHMTILVGINASNNGIDQELKKFQTQACLSQYVDIGNATPANLAKLANFVSKSISSQSQSLGTGGPSQPLTI